MTEKYIPYRYNGEMYDIPESKSAEFEKNYPSATIEMHMDGEIYDIPVSRKEEAIQRYGSNITYAFDKGYFDKEEDKPTVASASEQVEPEAEAKPDRKKKDRTGIFETVGKAGGAAGVTVGKIGVDTVNEGAKMGRKRPLYGNPLTGLAATIEAFTGKSVLEEDTPLNNASIKMGEVAEKLSKEADPTHGEKGLSELLKEGKVGVAAQKALAMGIESLPIMLASSAGPIGMVAYGTGMAASNYADDSRENPDTEAWKRGVYAVGTAATEMLAEKIGGPLKNVFGRSGGKITQDVAKEAIEQLRKEGAKTIKSRILNVLKTIGKEGLEEGGEEIITSFGNDALGEALDIIEGNKDYGIRAQWEKYKEQNPDATIEDFAGAKGNEYLEAFLGGLLSGAEISSLSTSVKEVADVKAHNNLENIRAKGTQLNYGNLYDADDSVKKMVDETAKSFEEEGGEVTLTREFIEELTAEDAYMLSRREDVTPAQKNALANLAGAKAMQEGLNQKLDERINEEITARKILIDFATEDGSVVTGTYNGRDVFVKGGTAKNGKVTLKNGQNGPVIIIDSATGEQITVRSEEIASVSSYNAESYGNNMEQAFKRLEGEERERYRNTMSPLAKLDSVRPYAGKKILVNLGNGVTEVYVQQVSPNGEVLIKGKKGDLGGQSFLTLNSSTFYDSIHRDAEGNPTITDVGKEEQEQYNAIDTTEPTQTPEADVDGTDDFRDYAGPILLNGVPVNVEVVSQDGPSNTIVYEYEDENGNIRRGSTTISGFSEAVQQAQNTRPEEQGEYFGGSEVVDGPTVAEGEAPVAPEAPVEVPVTPATIDWDALFDNDSEAYFAEMQNQFGDKTAKRLGAVVAATQKKLDALNNATPETDNEILENEEKKEKLEAKIEALNGMIARLSSEPVAEVAPTTPAPVETAPAQPVAPTAAQPEGNIPDVSVDKAADARARGFRMTNGQRVDRRGETVGVYGNDTDVTFTSDSKGKRTGKVKVIDAGNLVPSHIGGVENVEHFLPEAQPKKRTDAASTVSATLIAQNMDNPKMTNVASSAYEGAPIVNKRGEVIQGNNRSAAIIEMYQAHQPKAAEYKQYLIDHAAEFGLNADEVAAMQNPVLVRELDVDDSDAITLGQYTMQDMESGGSQMIDSSRAIAGLSNKGMLEDFIARLLAEENEETSDMNLSDLITRNGNEALKMLYQNGIINQTQYQSALGANGRITADARAVLRGIIEQQLFAGGIDNLSVMFEVLPDKAKKAIMQTISRDLKNPDDAKVTPYLQEAIEIYYQLNQQPDFVAAKTEEEVVTAIELFKGQTSLEEDGTPAEKYSNFAFELAKSFKVKTLKQQREYLNALYDAIAGVADIFGESEGKPLSEAVEEVYGTNLNRGNNETNGKSGVAVLEGGNGGSQEGQQGSTGNVGVRPEAGESGQGTTNGGANPTVGGGTQTTGEVTPVAPTPVDNPAVEAHNREKSLETQLKRYGIPPEQKRDMAFNAGKAVGDFFATREEYSAYEQSASAVNLGDYLEDFERGVEESFANRQTKSGDSQGNSVSLGTEPSGGNNGTETVTETPEGTEGYNGTTGGQHTDDEGGEEGTQEAEGLRGGDVNQEIKYPAREGDATRQLLMDTFGFVSVSPGISQENLNHIYDFLMEMSKMLGISPTSISHGATLGMGVLGGRSSSTLARYEYRATWDGTIKEPYIRFKNSLLSSIAHEWWHSLDQVLSYYETGRGKKPATTVSANEFTGRPEVLDAIREVLKAINKSGHKARLDAEYKDDPDYLAYSKRKKELAARFFEGYIKTKFAEAGIVVNGFAQTQKNTPTAEELKPVIPAFDRLFKVLKEKEGKKEGSTVLFQIGEEMSPNSDSRSLTNEAITISLNESGIEEEMVSDEQAEQMRILSGANTDPEVEFMVAPDRPVFVSNAARAVEGIEQEKATPEQWLKMIEKAGGLKAGEDKWMGLSEWLEASDKRTLTKQEVLDFINANTIQIEEVNYVSDIDFDAEEQKQIDALNDEFLALRKESEDAGEWVTDAAEIAYQVMADKYGDDFTIGFGVNDGRLYVSNLEAAASITGIQLRDERVINETRFRYTTDGLDNKKEIALVVPTIEPYRGSVPEIHFGDAGDGRAVAWVRFGETKTYAKEFADFYDYQSKMQKKYYPDRVISALDDSDLDALTTEEKAEFIRLREVARSIPWKERTRRKVLVIDEIQSQRHQDGREKGYTTRNIMTLESLAREATAAVDDFIANHPFNLTQEEKEELSKLKRSRDLARQEYFEEKGKIPDAPFDKNWHELAMKRMLRYAAENGYDAIAWTKGEQQTERYNLSKTVDSIEAEDNNNENFEDGTPIAKDIYLDMTYGEESRLLRVDADGNIKDGHFTGNKLESVVGKELAIKLMSEGHHRISGDGLKIGGEGMKGFYDKMLPAFMNKYGKKWGVKVSDITLPNVEEAGRMMHSVPVTQEMKDSVLDGQTMFMKRPNGTVYGWTDGKKIYTTKAGFNPNTRIHEYTHIWAKAMMQKNPKGWQSIKDLLRGTPVWDEVMNDVNYSSIHSNEDMVASEVLSRISGTENAAKLEQMERQMVAEAKGTMRKLEARGLIQRIKDALNQFWNWVGTELFGIESFESVEQVTDRVLWDLMNATDLGTLSEGQVETQIVTDPKVIAELEASPKRTGYRNVVQNADGTFSSPMAYWLQSPKEGAKSRVETAKFELGKWEEAEEHPELVDEKGHVTLVKPNKSTVEVAYDPYIHNRLDPVNLQFKDAWKRDELVYVETEVPETDLNSGYHADKALLPVGVQSWSNGDLMLSKYDKPVRIMPWEEVADAWVKRLNGEGVHFDVVPPALRPLLVERGVEILPPHKGMGKDCNEAYERWLDGQKNTGVSSLITEKNTNFVEQFEFKKNNERQELEYSDEFRRVQEESARMHERDVAEYHRGERRDSGSVRQRLGGTFQRELARKNIGGGNKILSHVNKSKGTSFDIIENVDGRLFHDIFAIVRNYLPNGELVDLHDNYNDAICYITTDGLAGFAVDKDGNLISVYSYYMQSKPGFLGAIKDLITEAGATHLDGYNSPNQPLAEIYSKVFGWKVASMMDYNMEYDHDNIAKNHEMPQVAFMVNTDADIETRHFDKDQYDEAVAYQLEQVDKSKENSLTSQNDGNTEDAYTANDGGRIQPETEGVSGEVPVSGPLGEGRRLARPENGKISQDGVAGFNPIHEREGESDNRRNNREAKFLSFVNSLTSAEQVNLYGFLKDYMSSPSGILRGRANDFINSIRQNGNNSFADFVEDFINDELKYREGISAATAAKHGLLVGILYDASRLEQIFDAYNKDDYNERLFDRAIKLAKRFGVSIRFVTRNEDGSFFSAFGNYNPHDNTITLDANLLAKGNESQLCQTIVHELIHSVVARAASIMTGRAVDKNNQFIDPQSLPKDVVDGINTLKEVYESIKDDGTFQDTYGKKDFEEMLSEITDPKFRGLLKAKKLWKKFLHGICQILGITDESSSETDALTEIELALDKILSAAERGELDSAYASYLGQLAEGYTLEDLQRLDDGPVKTLLTQNVLFRTGIDPTEVARESARRTYDRVVSDMWQEFQRQFQDAMQPVRIAIEAIQQETGNIPIEDYENYIFIQNQSEGRSREEIDDFARKYYSPIIEQIEKMIDQILDARHLNKKDKNLRMEVYAEIRQYLIAKHGLERNEYYQKNKKRKLNRYEKKKATDAAQAEYDEKIAFIDMNNNLTDAERELQKREAKDEFDAAVLEIDSREVPDIRDYSGLTALFGMDAKDFRKAEEEAKVLVDKFEKSLGRVDDEATGETTQAEAIEALWKRINKATDKTLRHSYESGLLSRQQFDDIKSMFQFYIPLRGFDETTAEDVYSYARFEGNRFNPAVQTAQGRTSVADDPIPIIMNMAESEIAQGNKNRAKQALYNFLLNRSNGKESQNSLMQIESVWYVKTVDDNGNESYTIATPDHANGETYEEFENRMQAMAEDGEAEKSKKGKVDVGMKFQKQQNRNAHYVYLKVNGVDVAIYVNGDPKAAEAINGTYRPKPIYKKGTVRTKNEKVNKVIEFVEDNLTLRDINRFISSTFTNYSLEFTARNYFRDMLYSHINIGIRESDPAYRKKFRQNWRHNNLGTMLKMLSAYRAGEYEGRALNEDEAAFVEFMQNGGQTGYTVINSVENHKRDLEKAIERMRKGIEKGGIKDSAAFKYTLGMIELLNEASELVTRFAAFKTSRDMGRGINTSINDAKEVTVNFNTKGAQDGTGWMGAIARYFGWSKFFFNASVQGVQQIKAMAQANKLKFCTTVGGVAAFGFMMPIITSALVEMLGGDDDEYWNIPEYDRQNNFCIPVGGGKYVKIPLPIGFREVYAIGDMVAAMAFDKKFTRDAGQVGMDIANKISSVVLPINPLESSVNGLSLWHTFLYTALPSSAQFAIQNATNVDWKGTPLQKEYTYNENDPQWMKAYASNPDWMVGLSKWCNEHIGAGDYKGMDWSPEKLDNTLSNLFGGIYTLIKKTGKSFSMIWNEENRNLSNIPLSGVVLGSGIDDDDNFVTDVYYDEKEYYDDRIGEISRVAKKFGYDLDDVFLKEKGKHHPKMQELIYNRRPFDFMQEWYKGNKELEDINDDIKKLEKEIAAKENPSKAKLNKLAKMKDKFAMERRDFVNDMLELD